MRNLWLSSPSAQTPAKEAAMRQDDQPRYWAGDSPFPSAGSDTVCAAEVSACIAWLPMPVESTRDLYQAEAPWPRAVDSYGLEGS